MAFDIPVRRYYNLAEISVMLDCSEKKILEYIKLFNIPTEKHKRRDKTKGITVVDARKVQDIQDRIELMKVIKRKEWIGSLPKYIIKELIKRL